MHFSEIDFSLLKKVNPDIVGWIRLPDTPIDYPVVQERNGDYYLTHNISGEESRHGAICLDSNPSLLFPDRQNRLRGHNMSDGSMFRALTSYLDPNFCLSHPVIEVLTENDAYSALIWAVLHVPYAEEYLSTIPTEPLLFEKWLKTVKSRSLFRCVYSPAFDSRNIVFCTCETEGEDGLAHGDVLVFGTLLHQDKECRSLPTMRSLPSTLK